MPTAAVKHVTVFALCVYPEQKRKHCRTFCSVLNVVMVVVMVVVVIVSCLISVLVLLSVPVLLIVQGCSFSSRRGVSLNC